ncbi:MAG: nicotinate (nicotinamide) nucleotide adenylyltransferase [Clostridia bacterium]|nr:nicotinate (nicotinamide) nucleotide adenylyltransferase [Clostridia bacterium]MBQ9517351.1 nicotinate (nicotinamide) nucleotide adenylyltransferase [Eubacterium sp.]
MKTGIFGGAFNPVHNGHLHLVKNYVDLLGLDRVLLIPTSVPPHKTADGLIAGEHRINMLRLATEGDDRFEVSDIEFRRGGNSYTYDTLCALREMYPDDSFYLIVGSDQYLTFDKWYRAADIADMVSICAAAREKDKYEQMLEFKAKNDFLNSSVITQLKVVEVSSTAVRNAVKNGESIADMVPPAVEKYIRDNRLYV